MATVNVKPRIGKNSISYRARVRINTTTLSKGYYEESKTFKNEATAKGWAKDRAKILTIQGIPNTKIPDELEGTTILNLICEYINTKKFQKLGRSKTYALQAIARTDLGLINTRDLNHKHIKKYVEDRRNDGVSPYTAYQDLLFLKSALRAGKKLSIYSTEEPVIEAIKDYKEDGDLVLEFQSNARDILASKREINLMRTELQKRQNNKTCLIPYLTIVDFAIDSCMRVSEICRVEWRDFNIEDRTLKIRERKHPKPGRQKHNNQTIPLIGKAFDILHSRKTELEKKLAKIGQTLNYHTEIFPYNPRSVSAGWQRCREKLIKNGENIENIRFHDLRAYGASKLINEGWDLSEISIVTGHKDINILNNIYMRNKPKDMALKDLIRKKINNKKQ